MKTIISIYQYLLLTLKTTTILSKNYRIALLLLSISGAILVLLSTSLYGAAVSPDSVYYISTARNLAEGKGLIAFDGTPFILWPPLYPLILAIPAFLFHIDPLASSPVINAIIFGLTVYFAGLLFSRYLISSSVYSLLGVMLILLSNILQDLATKAWSENLFILLVTVFLVYLDKYMLKKTWTSLIILSLSAAFAYLTRYIGVCLIMTGALVLFFSNWEKFRFRIYAVMVFSLISVVAIGILVLRNHAISGTFLGNRTPSDLTLSQNLNFVFKTLLDWGYFPLKSVSRNFLVLFLFIIMVSAFAGFMTKDNLKKIRSRLLQIWPIALFILIYVSFLLYSTTSFLLDRISMRFLSPVYIPLTLLLLVLIDILLDPVRDKISSLKVNMILVVTLIIWLVSYPLKGTVRNTCYWMKEGTGGYTSNEWRNSELVKYMQHLHIEPGQAVYSNEGEILYILTDIKCKPDMISISPGTRKLPGDTTNSLIVRNSINYDYFVYFAKYPDSCPYSKDQLENSANLMKIVQVSDGAVFSVQRIP